ncbi:MAG TPA: class I SAM-dependent methyltransferase [Anaeromyxobacteraceae bacterium]|nr:class I SAM-dependent methyltransferase [Anaeromyxobacteraceae bacterium]
MAYARLRPRSLLAAPLAAARWLERVDARITRRVVGIDPDMERVALARRRYRHLGAALEVYRADALEARLQPEGDFDLVLVALPVDGLAPEPLAALLAGWVAPGGACAIAGPGDPEDGGALASLLARCGMRRAGSFGARQAGAAPLRVTLLRSPGRAK